MHSFENRRVSISDFSSCVTSEDGCGRAVPYLQNDSAGDFQHSKQCKYKEKYLSKFSNVHKRKQTSLLAKVNTICFFLFQAAMLVPIEMGHQHGVSILSSINLFGTLGRITRVRNTAQTSGLDRVLIYLSSMACKFLDFIHWMVFDFYFDGVTVKTGHRERVRANDWVVNQRHFWRESSFSSGNLSTDVFEPQTATGSRMFSFFGVVLLLTMDRKTLVFMSAVWRYKRNGVETLQRVKNTTSCWRPWLKNVLCLSSLPVSFVENEVLRKVRKQILETYMIRSFRNHNNNRYNYKFPFIKSKMKLPRIYLLNSNFKQQFLFI